MKRHRSAPTAIAAALLALPLALGGCDRQPATSTQQASGAGQTTPPPAVPATSTLRATSVPQKSVH